MVARAGELLIRGFEGADLLERIDDRPLELRNHDPEADQQAHQQGQQVPELADRLPEGDDQAGDPDHEHESSDELDRAECLCVQLSPPPHLRGIWEQNIIA